MGQTIDLRIGDVEQVAQDGSRVFAEARRMGRWVVGRARQVKRGADQIHFAAVGAAHRHTHSARGDPFLGRARFTCELCLPVRPL